MLCANNTTISKVRKLHKFGEQCGSKHGTLFQIPPLQRQGLCSVPAQYCHCHTRNFPNKATTYHNLHWVFWCVLQFAMRKWRMKVGDLGFDLSDGMPHLIDLRFADDILLSARSAMEVRKLLEVAELSEVGLLLNAGKTVILTSQSQPLSTITIDHGITRKVLPGNVAQTWLGCMLPAYGSEQKCLDLDLQFHLQQAAKAYHANKWILEDRTVPISQRLRYFSSAACFASGHRTRNAYKLWTFTFVNSADPLCGLRRTLTGHLNGMRFCTLGTKVQHILLASQRYRVGPEFAVARIGNWLPTLPNFPFIIGYTKFYIGNLWGKGGLGG